MAGRRLGAASGILTLFLAGCSGPVGLYHSIEGGAIAQHRQPPPGYNLPYPNLADVPAAPKPEAPNAQAKIAAQVTNTGTGVSAPSPAALAGLVLPGAPPPLPNIPGLDLPATPSTPPPPKIVTPKPQTPPNPPPVSLAFNAGSAVLPFQNVAPLRTVAAKRGEAHVLVGGFGDGSLTLALARARRLADQLTAEGVPPRVINLVASRDGSGGFVQLVY
ncbi:hypothetical protein [Acidocella sp.]|jgi:hypothetical protein|uniref:hypothetical protein n=1 Tax=Acidocella sp. TaxID=50710 RepID=UPI002F4201E5